MPWLLGCPCDSVACTACLQLQQQQPTASAFDSNSEPLVLEKQRPVVWRWRALRCGNLFATQQRPNRHSGKAGIWTGPVNLGFCLKACQLSTQWQFPHWGVGDGLESLGNLPKCSERRRGFDLPLGIGSQGSIWLLLGHTDEVR